MCERLGYACVYIFIYEISFNTLIKLVFNVCTCNFFSEYCWVIKNENYSLERVEVQIPEHLVVKCIRQF